MPCAPWTVWQLIDSAFPSGGFTHSGGVEAAYKHGMIGDETSLVAFLEASLVQAGRQALPVIAAVASDPTRLVEVDEFVETVLLNHVQNRASRTQGRSLLAACARAFEVATPACPWGHLWPVWGAVGALLQLTDEQARRVYLFTSCRSQLSAAVRLGLVGPLRAQALLHAMRDAAERILTRSANLTLDDVMTTSPVLDLVQANQDRLYSRLFQS